MAGPAALVYPLQPPSNMGPGASKEAKDAPPVPPGAQPAPKYFANKCRVMVCAAALCPSVRQHNGATDSRTSTARTPTNIVSIVQIFAALVLTVTVCVGVGVGLGMRQGKANIGNMRWVGK